MIELEVVSGVAEGQRVRTNTPLLSIGRSPGHTLVISDPFVSRYHGEIFLLDSGYQYRDLNSTHGTILRRGGEDSFIREVVLRDGDELNFGGANNRMRIVSIASNDLERAERDITVLHAPQDRFLPPEDAFANDSKALRTIVQFDSSIMTSNLTTEAQLYRVLIEHIPALFDHLEHVAVLNWTEEKFEPYDYELVSPGSKVRLSTSVVSLAQREGRGIVYEVKREQAIVTKGRSAPLSRESQIRHANAAPNRTGICIPVEPSGRSAKFLQFERKVSDGRFQPDDIGLVTTMVSRVADRVESLRLVAQNQRLNLNASLGVFAGMIGHDIKNYLFYSKKLSEIRDDPLSAHPAIAKGIERSRKLAQGMKDLTAPGTVAPKTFSIPQFIGPLVDEFSSLFGSRCRFEQDLEPGVPPITSSEDLLSRVIWNLVMNAYHSMENRPRNLTDSPCVRVSVRTAPPGNVEFKVSDNAGGIGTKTFAYIRRSIRLIQRAYGEQKDLIDVVNEISGMGGFTNSIGLFFTAVATNDMSGTIHVETTPREGSVFTVQIPERIDALRNLLRF